MAKAIQCVGLEPELIKNDSECLFKLSIYAYLSGKIPILLGADLYDSTKSKIMGKHAVTITGFSLGAKPTFSTQYGLLFRSSRIDKIYAHDDQIGPFARMIFHDKSVPIKNTQKFSLKTTWPNSKGNISGVWLAPDISLIPLYKKIRISLTAILQEVQAFDKYIGYLRNNKVGQIIFPNPLEWEIFICDNSDFKAQIYNDHSIPPESRFKILTSPLPKFLWRAKAWIANDPILELLFDSTDLQQSNFFLLTIEYDQKRCQFIKSVVNNDPKIDYWKKQHSWRTLSFFHHKKTKN